MRGVCDSDVFHRDFGGGFGEVNGAGFLGSGIQCTRKLCDFPLRVRNQTLLRQFPKNWSKTIAKAKLRLLDLPFRTWALLVTLLIRLESTR